VDNKSRQEKSNDCSWVYIIANATRKHKPPIWVIINALRPENEAFLSFVYEINAHEQSVVISQKKYLQKLLAVTIPIIAPIKRSIRK